MFWTLVDDDMRHLNTFLRQLHRPRLSPVKCARKRRDPEWRNWHQNNTTGDNASGKDANPTPRSCEPSTGLTADDASYVLAQRPELAPEVFGGLELKPPKCELTIRV